MPWSARLWGCCQPAVIGGQPRRMSRNRARRDGCMSEILMAKIMVASDWWRAHQFPPFRSREGSDTQRRRWWLCPNPGYNAADCRMLVRALMMMIDRRRHGFVLSHDRCTYRDTYCKSAVVSVCILDACCPESRLVSSCSAWKNTYESSAGMLAPGG